jgi:hypothetical protein
MPPLLVIRGKGGELQILDGVTRATRLGKLLPGTKVRVEIISEEPDLDFSQFPTVGDRLP